MHVASFMFISVYVQNILPLWHIFKPDVMKSRRMNFIWIIASVLLAANNFANGCLEVDQLPKTADDPRLLAPWVASIFEKDNGVWKFKCGATLTSSFTVITAASCVTTVPRAGSGFYNQLHVRYTDLKVVVGLLTSNYDNRDEHTQESEVGMIREHKPPDAKTASGYQQAYARPTNLAGIRLKTSFELTPYVQPVCLVEVPNTPEEIITLRAGEKGVVSGFNVNLVKNSNTSKKLQNFQVTITDFLQCVQAFANRFVTVTCGRLSGSQNFNPLPCFLEGAGLIVSTDGIKTGVGKLYLMGIYISNTATINPRSYPYPTQVVNASTECTNQDLAFFTKHGEYYRWAISHAFCSEDLLQCQSDNCRPLEELCDGTANCADQTDESPEVCEKQLDCKSDQFRCAYGACIEDFKVCNGHMDCADNSDESDMQLCREADARRNITCSPIPKGKGVDTKCSLPEYLGGSEVDCDSAVPVGTRASQSCWRYYKHEDGPTSVSCQRNGTWSRDEFRKCSPDCGISEAPKVRFVVGGENVTNRGEWPWHTAIYRIRYGSEHYICGGSLISPKVILSAAHCVTDPYTGKPLLPSDHKVVLGKLSSVYGSSSDIEFSQEIPIEKFVVHENYNTNSLDSDIALIVLESSAEITGSVRPVCYTENEGIVDELFRNANPINGSQFGTTVGFGLDESKAVSSSLKKLKMPVIPKALCEESLRSHVADGIRFTWFCGGYTNGSSVCTGDSGGGFVFPLDSYTGRKFYLQGVLSHGVKSDDKFGDPCNKNTYKIFTQVIHYVPWIQNVVNLAETE